MASYRPAATGAARWSLGWRVYPVTAGLLVAATVELIALAAGVTDVITIDWDRGHYMDAARRFLDVGTPFLASEIAAPFDYQPLTFLHPPIALYLMVPFSMAPPILWYLVPVAIVGWCVRAWRPEPWSWPLLALCLVWPRTPAMLVVGNTDMWVAAFVASGLRLGWPALLVGIKPSLLPFVVAGVHRRTWWLGIPVALALALPFGSLWFDWLRVVQNAPGDPLYSLLGIPMVLLPVIAYLARTADRARGSEPQML